MFRFYIVFFHAANSYTSVFFLYGASPDMSLELQHALDTEIDKYGDIIKADGFIDSYNNITLKAMHTLKFFLNKGNFLPCALKNRSTS